MLDPRELRRLDEFCDKGSLSQYREVLLAIFEQIKSANCRIFARYDLSISSHLFHNNECEIRISLNRIYTEPIEIIWTILHEFGHHLSGDIGQKNIADIEIRLEREEKAWLIARKEVIKYPELENRILAFNSYKLKCLDTYTRNFGG